MLDYYTLQKTLETLSNDEHKYIAKDIATLCRQGKLTPYFSYNRYTAEKIPMTDRTGKDCEDFEPGTIRLFNDGYLTNHQLLDLLDGYSDSVVIGYAHDERGYECELFFNAINSDRYFNDENYSPYSDNDVLTVTKEHLSFKREQVQSYIASRQTNEQNTPEQQEIAKLKKEIANLQKQLEERNDTPAYDTLLTAIHDKSNEYHAPDLSHAVKLWSNLYIDGLIGTDSHSNKADRWINSNTSYGNNAEDSSVKRLRQVSTPLKDFGGQRKR